MKKKTGKLIVIDGSNGSGKKTQSDLLLKNLEKAGYQTAFYDFPQYDKSFFGKMIADYLNGEFGDVNDANPYLISLLYAGDRWSASEKIKQDLAAGKIIVSNRYIQSNMAFSGARFDSLDEKKKFLDWLYELEYKVYGIPKADLVLYLYVSYRTGQLLVDQKNARDYTKMKRDIHERDSAYLKKVEETYLWLSKECPEWKKIDCIVNGQLDSIDNIAKKVYATAKEVL